MTDRVHSLTVVLDYDIREDDVDAWVGAILLLKGVISVKKNITDVAEHMAQERAKHELREKLWEIIKG